MTTAPRPPKKVGARFDSSSWTRRVLTAKQLSAGRVWAGCEARTGGFADDWSICIFKPIISDTYAASVSTFGGNFELARASSATF